MTKFIFSLFFFLFINLPQIDAQRQFCRLKIQRNFTKENILFKKDSLIRQYTDYKTYPKSYELAILTALSFFPELQNTFIEFAEKDIHTTMACQPSMGSVFRTNRSYKIFIDDRISQEKNVLLSTVPFNAQVGVIAHELCHILDYEELTLVQLAKLGINYLDNEQKPHIEKRVDRMTIKKGLGWQLYDWSNFVLNLSEASNKYKKFKRETYLTPEEILEAVKGNRMYQHCLESLKYTF